METIMLRQFFMTLVFLQFGVLLADAPEHFGSRVLSGDNNDAQNTVVGGPTSDSNAVVAGGSNNKANATHTAVLGGQFNEAGGSLGYSTVCGGKKNKANNSFSFIGGGENNITNGLYSAVVAGGGIETTDQNKADGKKSIVGAGESNVTLGDNSGILSGKQNTIFSNAMSGFIGGGKLNKVQAESASVCGGENNAIDSSTQTASQQSHIGGGLDNLIADGMWSVIAGGNANTINGDYSAIPGGRRLTIDGNNSFGFNASATTNYTIANNNVAAFMAVDMGINTVAPDGRFHVNGGQVVLGDEIWPTGTIGKSGNRVIITDGTEAVLIMNNRNVAYGKHRSSLFLGASSTVDKMAWGRIEGGKDTDSGSSGFLSFDVSNSAGGLVSGMYINRYGYVGVGMTNPYYRLDVNGPIRCAGITITSDRRFKKNISSLNAALDTIQKLRGVSFEYEGDNSVSQTNSTSSTETASTVRNDNLNQSKIVRGLNGRQFSRGKSIGFIAQEVEKVVPSLIAKDADGYLSVNYSAITAINVEAIKALKIENDALREELITTKHQVQLLMETIFNKKK
jgi:hypothetical protein